MVHLLLPLDELLRKYDNWRVYRANSFFSCTSTLTVIAVWDLCIRFSSIYLSFSRFTDWNLPPTCRRCNDDVCRFTGYVYRNVCIWWCSILSVITDWASGLQFNSVDHNWMCITCCISWFVCEYIFCISIYQKVLQKNLFTFLAARPGAWIRYKTVCELKL